jgi:hypothetical protein
MAAVRYLTNRINKYHLNTDSKEKEKEIIEHILQANKYDTSIVDAPLKTKNRKATKYEIKWAKFTYVGKETNFVTKLFKNSIVNVSYTTRNTIASLLSQKPSLKKNKF